jgi:hypothetical protein
MDRDMKRDTEPGETDRVRRTVATVGLVVPTLMALGMSADTSFRFLGAVLGIVDPAERGVLTGTAEAAVIALTLYAWATSTRLAARIAYLVVLVQAVPAFEVSGGYGGMVRTALGPVLLVVLLHLLLGLELRMSRVRPSGIVADILREARERLVAYLGIGRRGTDSAAIARSRAADRAVVLADRVAEAPEKSRKRSRRSARLSAAVDAARHGLDASDARAMEAAIVARVVRRKSVDGLAGISIEYDWAGTVTETVSGTPGRVETSPKPVSRVSRPALAVPSRETAPGGTELLTTVEAAALASQLRGETVTAAVIRNWKWRSRLIPATDVDGTLYERDAVVAAELKTRRVSP